jgi:hypothetical protein
MGYYNIEGHKVFITKETDRELWNEVTLTIRSLASWIFAGLTTDLK